MRWEKFRGLSNANNFSSLYQGDTLEIVNHINKEFKQLEELIRFKEDRLAVVKTRIRELEDKLGVKSQ